MDDGSPPRKRQRRQSISPLSTHSDFELVSAGDEKAQESINNLVEAEAGSWILVDVKGTSEADVASSAASSATMPGSQPKAVDPVLARWCGRLEGGTYHLDDSKISNLLSTEERDDNALLGEIIHGLKLTSRLQPLVFDNSSEDDHEHLKLRSLPFFRQILNGDTGKAMYGTLDREQKKIVGTGVRDLYLAERKGLLIEPEKQLLEDMIMVMDEEMGRYQLPGINASAYPSANYNMLKLVEASGNLKALAEKWSPYFAQVVETPPLFAVFVNPAELSYHNFENIVPLDRWIEAKGGLQPKTKRDLQSKSKVDLQPEKEGPESLSLSFTEPKQVKRGFELWTCELQGAFADLIKQIPSLDLYVQPLNKQTRGGERFIFNSALLSQALTKAVRDSSLLDELTRGKKGCHFEFVNYVFRCNRFAPGQAVFSSHRDTPYYDRDRRHVSKFTLLIYLTAGRGEPALKVKDVDMHSFEEMACVIFDQRYEHEGRPYMDGHKIFLRTELIFRDNSLSRNDRIAPLFSQACYMSGQSLLDQRLAAYAHECFERANSLHWALEHDAVEPTVYLQKKFSSIHFITNGYDYWFAKLPGIEIQDVAMIAVLDYFNCRLDGQAFNSLSSTSTAEPRFNNSDEILRMLSTLPADECQAFRRLSDKDVDSRIQRESKTPFLRREASWEEDEGFEKDEEDGDPDDEGSCCPFHHYSTYDAWCDPDVQRVHNQCWEYTRKKLFEAPLLLLDNEVVINDSSIKVFGDKVYFLQKEGTDPIPPINFAACWNCEFGASDLIDVDGEINAPKLLIPPVMFSETENGFHLVLDFFRNDWMIKVDEEQAIPLPVITNNYPEDEEGNFIKRLDAFTEYNEGTGLKIMEDHPGLKKWV